MQNEKEIANQLEHDFPGIPRETLVRIAGEAIALNTFSEEDFADLAKRRNATR